MRKGVFLLAISYALLVSCSSAVSLADNYAEDENYYDPTLPHHSLHALLDLATELFRRRIGRYLDKFN